MKKSYLAFLGLLCIFLFGCGQSGPLYLPAKQPPQTPAPAPAQ